MMYVQNVCRIAGNFLYFRIVDQPSSLCRNRFYVIILCYTNKNTYENLHEQKLPAIPITVPRIIISHKMMQAVITRWEPTYIHGTLYKDSCVVQ